MFFKADSLKKINKMDKPLTMFFKKKELIFKLLEKNEREGIITNLPRNIKIMRQSINNHMPKIR